MLAYIGPESVSGVYSALAAIAGVILIGWRWIKNGFRKLYRTIFRIPAPPAEDNISAPPAEES